ncbi:NIF3-like protein 1 [Portunus trituberculatus]|uniref:NIF3-like protein 1 n=1 Tax=Portunus trituberculatus TaxID=210409 RepID=UPI001E1CC847|nr:NIF3-like protein 1 [Portunus trituberculatus]XP_045116943.1 NIF3-like protein 1 [Portunus trituberculatus]
MLLRRLILPTARTFHCRHYSMELKEIVAVLNRFAAPSLAESWDNVGLLVQPYTQREIKTVLLTNDLSEEVMDEAVQHKADLILSYHPPLFRPFKKITTGWKDRIVACCLEKGIAVYSPHTAYDTLKGGVNDWLLKAFDVGEVTPLQQKDVPLPHSHQVEAALESDAAVQDLIQRVTQEVGEQVTVLKYGTNCMKVLCGERDLPAIVSLTSTNSAAPAKLVVTKLEKVPLVGHGAGRRGSLAEPITVQQAISRVKTHLGLPHLRVALAHGSTLDTQVNSVAVCAGSGVSVLRGASADLWLTGEMSHHEVLDATHGGSTVILVDHSNSERGFLKELQPTLHQLFEEKVNVLISQKDRDPLQII